MVQNPDRFIKLQINFRRPQLLQFPITFTRVISAQLYLNHLQSLNVMSVQCNSQACQASLWVHVFVPFEVYTCRVQCTNFPCPASLKSHNDAETQRNQLGTKQKVGLRMPDVIFLNKWIGFNISPSQYIQDDRFLDLPTSAAKVSPFLTMHPGLPGEDLGTCQEAPEIPMVTV